MKIPNYLKLIIALAATQAAGLIGTIFTTPAIPTWYANLAKPTLNPPSAVFGPVWTTLYVLMAISAFIIWKKGLARKDVKVALGVFLGQLVLNTLWSIIFFGAKNLGGALIEISLMWLAIIWTIVLFWKISKPAAWLLIPYVLWVTFAGYLNYMIWAMN